MSKLIRACIAVAAFAAFAVLPATAMGSNDATLVEADHKTSVPLGTGISGTTTETSTFTNAAGETLVSCETGHLGGSVHINNHTETAGTISSASFTNALGGKCSSPLGGATQITTNVGNGTPWCLRTSTEMSTHHFQVRGGDCTSAARPITFVMHTTNIGECRYSRSAPITGEYTTTIAAGAPDLHIYPKGTSESSEFVREAGSGFFCPGAGFLDMTINLERTVGTADVKIINAT